MTKKKRYAAFLSFAHPDRDLILCLKSLFGQLNKEVFFSLQELPKAKSREWRSKTTDAIHDSTCFVPIYTRHSLRREWVLYESGIADAYKLHRLPARVASVSPSDIEDLPSPGAFVYDLSEKDLLARLVTNVCVYDGERRSGFHTKGVQHGARESTGRKGLSVVANEMGLYCGKLP